MGLLTQRKAKKFDVPTRYYKKDGEGSPYEIHGKFDEFRTTYGKSGNIVTRFKRAANDSKKEAEKGVYKRTLIIIVVLLFLALWFFGFDLSFMRLGL